MTNEQKPFSPKLKSAMAEIKEIVERYDIGGVVILHTPGNSEYANFLEPSYSCASFEQTSEGVGIRFRSKAADFKGGAKERNERIEDTANLMNMLAVTTGQVSLSLMDISEKLDGYVKSEHGKMKHRGHGEKRNDDETDSKG